MSSGNRRILLVNQQVELSDVWLGKMNSIKEGFIILDPEKLFSELDWTRYEDDFMVINKIYTRLFEDVVMNNKRLVCFWPLDQQYGKEWLELVSLCNANSQELGIYKNMTFEDSYPNLSVEILCVWKRFANFLIETLLEDLKLNEKFDEIATLKSDQETIVLFKSEHKGTIRYSFASNSEIVELESIPVRNGSSHCNHFQVFDTFNEMLELLLKANDLNLFDSKFIDGGLEKAYFRVLSKEFKTRNLIETWLKTYSIN